MRRVLVPSQLKYHLGHKTMLRNNASQASRVAENSRFAASRFVKVAGLGLAVLFLTGCAFAPGSHVDREKDFVTT